MGFEPIQIEVKPVESEQKQVEQYKESEQNKQVEQNDQVEVVDKQTELKTKMREKFEKEIKVTISVLKEYLKTAGLKTSGSKEELVDRLNEYLY